MSASRESSTGAIDPLLSFVFAPTEMLFLAVEFHIVLLCSRNLVEGQGQLP